MAVARIGTVRELGAFGAGYGLLVTVAAAARGYLGEARLIEDDRTEGRAPWTPVLVWSLGTLLTMSLPLLWISSGDWPITVALAVASVLVVAQDTLRYEAIRRQAAIHLILSDALWLMVAATALLAASVASAIGYWATGAVISAGVLLVRSGGSISLLMPRPRVGTRFAIENATMTLTAQATLIILGFASLLDVGGIVKALQISFAPIGVMATGLAIVVLGRSTNSRWNTSALVAFAAAASAGWALLLMMPLPAIGSLFQVIVGDSAPAAAPYIWYQSAITALGASTVVVVARARTFRTARTLRTRIQSSLVYILAVGVGVARGGIPDVLAAMIVGGIVSGLLWIRLVGREQSELVG